jgi:hypothetical protein
MGVWQMNATKHHQEKDIRGNLLISVSVVVKQPPPGRFAAATSPGI